MPVLDSHHKKDSLRSTVHRASQVDLGTWAGPAGPVPGGRLRLYPDIGPSKLLETYFSGTGEKTNDSCGLVRYQAVCSVTPGHFSYPVSYHCGNPLCPECYKAWQSRASDRIGSRTWGYKEASGHGVADPWHVVWSLPSWLYRPDLPTDQDVSRIRKIVQRFARASGSKGGCQVVHLYRIKDECAAAVQDARSVPGGFLPRYDALKTFPNWREMVEYSPHVHDIQYGFLVPSRKLEDGWVYRKIRPLHDRDEIERLAYYLLGHTPILPGRTAMTYYGVCGYHSLRVKWHYCPMEPGYCPVCGAPLVYESAGVMTNEEVLRRKTRHSYFLAPPPGGDTR